MNLPDVSDIAPVEIPVNATRSPLMELTIVNEYTKYETMIGYWDDVQKCFYSGSRKITDEVVKTNPL